ncbi:epoxide hydrolase 1-like [Cheilinus undulatus]|uniref:epoxide hydrolase 1-like n=1 Tax=Cheilinus undulatus TaxID=241271 RepID=UPI001BD370B6|nr:epoxide hydrolase 1-like [Cheilinus undulatus]XP_041644705.1 epoxide hydrolase 1-like [Cheilinus undulatus]
MQRLQVLKETLLGLDLVQRQALIGSAVAAGGILAYMIYKRGQVKTIPLGEGWWGAGEKPLSEDNKIYPFTVETPDEEIKDLHDRIDRTRYTDPLEDSRFHYGFNSTHLKKVVKYWRHEFDWKKQVAELNKFPHFKTKIEGLDVHFIHVRPQHRANQRVLPLMLVHGWPGSFYEFYKILPLLTERQGDVVFEVVCPSIPGYGYSEAPHKQGFNSLAAARVFLTLMERLGFSEFYLQGGDWGSLITTNMAQMKPECVKGLHLNMAMSNRGLKVLVSLLIGPYLPFLVGFSREDVRRLFPFFEKNVYEILRESGYLHIQATKPDTAGCGVNNSPVGLAAYILEKFSTWTDMKNRDLVDGGLEKKFSLDELLTNVMIYWTTSSIVPSMRFYKENMKTNIENRVDSRTAIYVPTGLAAFPNELMHTPESWAQIRYKKIYSYTLMPRGGHFAAFEEPQLLADDVIQFVKKVEQY